MMTPEESCRKNWNNTNETLTNQMIRRDWVNEVLGEQEIEFGIESIEAVLKGYEL